MKTKKCSKYYYECELCYTRKRSVKMREKRFDNKLICDNCYKTEINHPVEYTPPIGEVHYDDKGRLICHECGRAYDKLTIHLIHAHNITPDKYKEKWMLNRTFKLTSDKLKKKYRESNLMNNLKPFDLVEYNRSNDPHFNRGKLRRLQFKKNQNKKKNQQDEE